MSLACRFGSFITHLGLWDIKKQQGNKGIIQSENAVDDLCPGIGGLTRLAYTR